MPHCTNPTGKFTAVLASVITMLFLLPFEGAVQAAMAESEDCESVLGMRRFLMMQDRSLSEWSRLNSSRSMPFDEWVEAREKVRLAMEEARREHQVATIEAGKCEKANATTYTSDETMAYDPNLGRVVIVSPRRPTRLVTTGTRRVTNPDHLIRRRPRAKDILSSRVLRDRAVERNRSRLNNR